MVGLSVQRNGAGVRFKHRFKFAKFCLSVYVRSEIHF